MTLEELANFILREFDPRTGDWSKSIIDNLNYPWTIQKIMEAGFCPDVLEVVEPEDCIDPERYADNLVDRSLYEQGLWQKYRTSC